MSWAVYGLAGVAIALILFGWAELGLRGLAYVTGRSLQPPPSVPSSPGFKVLCAVDDTLVRLCPDPSGEPRRVREAPFCLAPKAQRVVVIGESFVHGLRLNDDEAWPARMGEHLGDDVEVLNFGRSGSESDRLRYVARAAIAAGAQVAVLSVGNNEYTMTPYYAGLPGRYPVQFQAAFDVLSHFHVYGALKALLAPKAPPYFARRRGPNESQPIDSYLDALHRRPVDTRLFPDNLVDPDLTALLEQTKLLSERFYRHRMSAMIEELQAAGVQVVLTTLPHALSGFKPVLSGLHGVSRAQMTPVIERLRGYDVELKLAADAVYLDGFELVVREGLGLDPQNALLQYALGHLLLRQGDLPAAKEALAAATGLDLVPDVTPAINGIIAELSRSYDLPLIDLSPVADAALTRPARAFVDAIHVNTQGADLVGTIVARGLIEQGVLSRPARTFSASTALTQPGEASPAAQADSP